MQKFIEGKDNRLMGKKIGIREKARLILSELGPEMRDAIYRSVWFDHVCNDVRAYEKEMDLKKPLTEDQVHYAAERYVYDGQYNCNCTYWTNIEIVINLALDYCPDDKKGGQRQKEKKNKKKKKNKKTRLVLTVSNIDWDYEEKGDSIECPASLPKQIVIDDSKVLDRVLEGIDGDADALAEYLTETYHCCVCGFAHDVEEVKCDD